MTPPYFLPLVVLYLLHRKKKARERGKYGAVIAAGAMRVGNQVRRQQEKACSQVYSPQLEDIVDSAIGLS